MRNYNKILALLLALALTVGVCLALAGCGETEPEPAACTSHVDTDGNGVCDNEGCNEAVTSEEPAKTTYTVTLVDNEGAPVVGATVVIETNKVSSATLTTDSTGKATADLAVGTGVVKVKATVKSVPAGYILPASAAIYDQGATSATVTIQRDYSVAYTVRLVDEDGNSLAIAGANVQICQSLCQNPVATDENGVAIVTFVPETDTYIKVLINNIDTLEALSGYTYADEVDADGYVHFDYDANDTVIELVLKAK